MASEEVAFMRVKALLPQADAAHEEVLREKSTRLYVAILKHHLDDIPQNPAVEDFMWLKAHGRLPLTRIIAAYQAQVQLDDDSPLVLKVDGQSYPDDTLVSQIPVRERFLIMSAHVEQQPASQQSVTSTQSSRPPLQPVSRQLTVPPSNSSQDENAKAVTPALSASAAIASPPPPAVNASPLVNAVENVSRPSSVAQQPDPSNVDVNMQMAPVPPTQAPQQREQVKQESPAADTSSVNQLRVVAPHAEEQEQETQYEPRDQGNPFAAFPNVDEVEQLRGQNLQRLAAETMPERLEAGIVAGLEVLDRIQHKLEQLGDHEDAVNWRKQIEKVRKDASKTRTVVGVVGNTGAGKSSVINAMLEEERLVPTNCMRACTAVVTELSYNESTNPRMKYRAVIEFINLADWEKELHVLFKEIFDDSGHLSREIANPDSEAGVAYAKVRAVYYKHTREMLANTTVASLMNQKHVKNVLGKVRTIREAEPKSFYEQLQKFVDSKEKGSVQLDKNGKPITTRRGSKNFGR